MILTVILTGPVPDLLILTGPMSRPDPERGILDPEASRSRAQELLMYGFNRIYSYEKNICNFKL